MAKQTKSWFAFNYDVLRTRRMEKSLHGQSSFWRVSQHFPAGAPAGNPETWRLSKNSSTNADRCLAKGFFFWIFWEAQHAEPGDLVSEVREWLFILAEFSRLWPTWHLLPLKSLKALAVGRQSGAVTCNIPQSQCLPSRTACITPFPYEMPRGHLAGFVKIAACHYVAPSNYIKIHEVWVRLEVYDKSIAIRLHFDRHHSGAHLTVQIPGFTRTRCGLVLGARSLCLFAAASAAKNQFEHQYLDVVSMPCCGLVLRISSCWMMWLYARRQLTIMTVAGAATGYRAWCAVRGKSKAGVHPTEMQGGICVGLFARYIKAY